MSLRTSLAAAAAAGLTLTAAGVLVLPASAQTAPPGLARAEVASRWHLGRTPHYRRPPRPPVTPSPTPAPTATPTPTPSATPTPTATPSPTTTPSPTPTAPAGYTVRSDWAASVLSTLNAERTAHGLPALVVDARLVASAHTHNQAMATANTLSHQLDGEAGLGARVTAAGYPWSSVGENIAYNSQRTSAGVLALQEAMYGETPPDDGHRRNILSTGFTSVGIDVIDDAVHRRVWLVTDFGRPR